MTAVLERAARRPLDRLREAVGDREQARVVVLFAAVLALESADLGTIGAVAKQLEREFSINHAQLGLLASVSLVVSALGTIPFGVLADRMSRVRMLWITVAIWSAAMAAVGAAPSFTLMIVARLGLGLVMAAAGPALASLAGDYFEPRRRARIFGLIGVGELVGAGFGFVISGSLTAALSWRFAFWVLAPPAIVLSWVLRRLLHEPERGRKVKEEAQAGVGEQDRARRKVGAAAEADRERVLAHDVDVPRMPLPRAFRYVLTIRTNLMLIAASAIGYFFFAGVRTFAVEYLRSRFHLSQAAATGLIPALGAGALVGVVAGGAVADRLLRRGRVNARIDVPAVCFAAAVALLLPGLLLSSLMLGVLLYALAAAAVSAANPPLDSARLDIVPHGLWGRAESARTFLRELAQAGAPLLFGVTADAFDGRDGAGVRTAFLIMLVPLVANGWIVWRSRRSYARDVATALASERTAL